MKLYSLLQAAKEGKLDQPNKSGRKGPMLKIKAEEDRDIAFNF